MLRLENLEISQDDWRMTADIALEPGSATALIGPSGAGKSTLLAVIAGFLAPARGHVLWDGRDITALPPAERPVTLLFQDHNLFAHLTAAQNVGLGLRPDLRLDRAGWARVAGALASVGLAGMDRRLPGQLSGGERQRVALARALLRDRPIMMLDEPFAALGPALRAEMLDLVARIRAEQRATLLMVTHDPRDALRIAEQTVLVMDGAVAPPAATGPLLADPPPALRAYLG
ncbi:thiamine ABC transporter ATP-binding protein [uncultured Amaricoccus sp.]|uniref:thiamine ABC transporter ATP-binding protein n=1 Tax=uncultured Amaricoccus sp. TaxID=339341 RepID=UPI0026167D8E|nr:thiamine ABC transporter ATP-binding protein [uncultured Amaricoccus sp.]